MKQTRLLFILFTLPFFFSNCTKDRTIDPTTQETLVRGNWGIEYYFNGQNQTTNYTGYNFLFSNTGLLAAQKPNEIITGSWNGTLDTNSNEVYGLNFNTTDANLIQLNGQWKLISKSSTAIEFEKNENGGTREVFRIRKY